MFLCPGGTRFAATLDRSETRRTGPLVLDTAALWRDVCIVGDNPFSPELLQALETKTVKKRPIRISILESLSAQPGCQILFISRSMKDELPDVFQVMGKQPMLLISDIKNFATLGGMIELKRRSNKIEIIINLTVTQSAGLRLKANLLSLARIVK